MNGIEWPILSHSDPIQFSQVPPLTGADEALARETSLRSPLGRWSPGELFARPFGVFALSFPYGA